MAQPPPQLMIVSNPPPFDAFDPNGEETLSQYHSRFERHCDAHFIPQEPRGPPTPEEPLGPILPATNRRRNLFLASLGARAFASIHAASLPHEPHNYDIPQIVGSLKLKYENPSMVETNRMFFNQRTQRPDESVFDFLSALAQLAVPCEFGPYYEDAMKGRLITGIRHSDTRAKLLAPGLTFVQSKVLALQDDAIRIQMRSLAQSDAARISKLSAKFNKQQNPQGNFNRKPPEKPSNPPSNPLSQPKNVNFKKPQNPVNPKRKFGPCHRCTKLHDVKTCPAINWDCHTCGTKGHTAAAHELLNKKRVPVHNMPVSNIPQGSGGGPTVDQEVDQLLDF